MKGQVLHLLRVQLKVPGDSTDFNVLLTTKSLMFLLRLNEMSGERLTLETSAPLFDLTVVKLTYTIDWKAAE